jgi:hypothetical protein
VSELDEYGAGDIVFRRNVEQASDARPEIRCPFPGCYQTRASDAAMLRHEEMSHPPAPPPHRSLRERVRDARDAFRD